MALEAWIKFAKPGEKFDETEPPSEASDRQEVVVLLGESQHGHEQKFLPIFRSDNGNFFGFGEENAPSMDEMTGRFAQMLPTRMPNEEIRERQGPAQNQRCWPRSRKSPAAEIEQAGGTGSNDSKKVVCRSVGMVTPSDRSDEETVAKTWSELREQPPEWRRLKPHAA